MLSAYYATVPIIFLLDRIRGTSYPVGAYYSLWHQTTDVECFRGCLLKWASLFGVRYEFSLTYAMRATGHSYDSEELLEIYGSPSEKPATWQDVQKANRTVDTPE